MELLLALVIKQEFSTKKVERPLTSCIILSTVAVMSFNWHQCKLLILHQVSNLVTLWKFIHYPQKCADSLMEIQKVLDLP